MNRQPEPRASLRQLVEFYEVERQLYELLLRLSEVQLEALKAEATPEEFVLLTEQKESVLRSIERIERMVKPLKMHYVEQSNGADAHGRDRLERTLDQILALMDKIAANEEASRTILEKVEVSPATCAATRRTAGHSAALDAAARIRAQVQEQFR